MRTPPADKTPEHRSRELMNLVAWAGRCAALPGAGEAERRWWHAEVERAWTELKHEFPYYCNGGIFPQDTVATIAAFRRAGMADRADAIGRQIYRRQHEGIFPNGSGFYMGVVNLPGQCYSIMKWDGTPTDYEGIISRDCSFLQTTVLDDDPARPLFNEAARLTP